MTDEPIMMAEPDEDARHWADDEPAGSVKEAFARLYTDGRAYADAEIERQKLRVGIAGAGVRDAAIFGVAGALLAFAALVALLVGLVLVLTPYIGAGWATFAVVGASLLIAFILLLIAKARITKMREAIRS